MKRAHRGRPSSIQGQHLRISFLATSSVTFQATEKSGPRGEYPRAGEPINSQNRCTESPVSGYQWHRHKAQATRHQRLQPGFSPLAAGGHKEFPQRYAFEGESDHPWTAIQSEKTGPMMRSSHMDPLCIRDTAYGSSTSLWPRPVKKSDTCRSVGK